jgi:nucleoside-triphosphatase THEP1
MLMHEMAYEAPRIAALRGAPSAAMQILLDEFAQRRARAGLRVAGVVEDSDCAHDGACKRFRVRDLLSGETISISQDLGRGSTACNLDPAALVRACGRIETAISEGADLVVLSKFGKLEAARSGLADAFRAAIEADIPVLTVVSPAAAEEWENFAAPLFQFVDASCEALEIWWARQVPQRLPWPAEHAQERASVLESFETVQ